VRWVFNLMKVLQYLHGHDPFINNISLSVETICN